MEAAGLEELLPVLAAIEPRNGNSRQRGKECPVIIALLAVLSADLIVIAVLLAGVLSRRRWMHRQPDAFKGYTSHQRQHPPTPARRHRSHGRWGRDILVWTPLATAKRRMLHRSTLAWPDPRSPRRRCGAGIRARATPMTAAPEQGDLCLTWSRHPSVDSRE
jgi:hypothetical protein